MSLLLGVGGGVGLGRAGGEPAELAELAGAVELRRDGDAYDVARTRLPDGALVAVADGLDVGALPGDGVGGSVGELGGRVHDAEGAGALLAQAGDLRADVAGGDPAHVAGAALDH